MTKKNNISNNPSYSKARKDINSMYQFKHVIDFLSVIGIKEDKLNEALKEVPNFRNQIEKLSNFPDKFNHLYAKRGWIAHESMNSPLMEQSIELGESDIDKGEELLANYFTSFEIKWNKNKFKYTEPFSKRYKLIEKAYSHTITKNFNAGVLILLTIIDGVVNDITKSKGFFSEKTELNAWDSIAAHETGLSAIRDIFNSPRKRTNLEEIYLPYRNGILHGRDLNYGNKFVLGKCWITLIAIHDWNNSLTKKEPPKIENRELTLKENVLELQNILEEYQANKIEHAKKREELNKWKPRKIQKFNKSEFNANSPEAYVAKILDAWINKNYGRIAMSIHRFTDEEISINEEAGKIREELKDLILQSYEVKNINDLAPSISMIDVKLNYALNEKTKSKNITMRMLCKNKNGEMEINGKRGVYWNFIDNFFFRLYD